jgi:hypothetical protein
MLSVTLMVCLVSALLQAAASAKAPAAPLMLNETYDFKNVHTGAGGGFIVDVIFHPSQQNLIYAKTDMGGVYRWEQSSGRWTQLLNWVTAENWNWTGGESVAVDPSDPNRLYIAGGTYTNSWSPDNGVILRSTDRGETFQVTQMPFKMGGNMPGRGMGERLAVDPNRGSILFFGARDGAGLWKSTDYGVTWSRVTNFPVTGVYAEDPNDTQYDYNNHPVGIPWVIFDPSTGTPGNATQTIYAGVADGRSGQPNIYRSTNGGSTWAAIPGQPTCTQSGNIVTCTGGVTWDVTALGDDGLPATPKASLLAKQGQIDSQGTLYVSYSSWAGPYRGNFGDVWKFVPGTSTWTQISPANAANGYCLAGITPYWGYGGLGLDMQNPGTLVVAAVNSWWPDGQLFRSTDGGATWKCLWEYQAPITGWPPTVIKHFSLNVASAPWLAHGNPQKAAPEASVKLGWMMEGLKIDPFNANRMMYGTGETLYGTTNLSAWDTGGTVNISSMATGMEQTSVLSLASPSSGTAHLFSAVGDVGGWRHDNLDASPSMVAGYTIPDSGTMTSIDYAELSPSFLVRVGSNAAFTYDSGGNWFQGNADIGNYGTVAAAANASRVLWAPDGAPVSWSSDNGNAWNASANIPQNSAVASDRVNASKFYGLGGSKFWVSTDGGATFTASAAAGLPESGEVRAVFGREGDVWVAGGGQISGGSSTCTICGLWHTANSGSSFTKLANVEDANAIGFGMAKPGGSGYPAVFLAGKVAGVRAIFRSDDMGATWINITDAKHQFATIQTITGDPRIYGRVYFGTNGLGIFYGDISGVQQPTFTPTPTFTGSPGTVTVTPSRTNTPTPSRTNTPTFTFTPTQPVGNNTGWISPSGQASQSGGDGNGFQTSPANAFADGGGTADDVNSGTGTSTSCTSTSKDQHAYFNYPLSIPSGSTINGIEVRTDARVDSASGTRRFCVQLSWNNGASWTTMKTGSNLSTTERTDTFGSSSDTWGRTWNTSELTSANLRVRIVSVASSTSRDFFLDWLPVRVWYSGGGPTNTPTSTPTLTRTPTPTTTACALPTPQPLWVEPVTSPTDQTSQVITVRVGYGDSVTVTHEFGSATVTGDFSTSNPALVTVPLQANATHHLRVSAHVRSVTIGGCTYSDYTLITANDRFGAPLTIVQTDGTITPTFTPTATTPPTTLRVQYRAADTNAGDNQIKPHFNIVNAGTSPVPLSELKIRYWFTREGTQNQSFWCDWAAINGACSNVSGTFVQVGSGADFYLEVSFAAAAGSIAAGGQSGEIQTRISKSDWSNYTETGDYSFDPTKTSFADWTRVTLYRNGVLIWGVEP